MIQHCPLLILFVLVELYAVDAVSPEQVFKEGLARFSSIDLEVNTNVFRQQMQREMVEEME